MILNYNSITFKSLIYANKCTFTFSKTEQTVFLHLTYVPGIQLHSGSTLKVTITQFKLILRVAFKSINVFTSVLYGL